jgi:arylsulfatase
MTSRKNISLLTSALLLTGGASAQYSPTPKFEGKIGKTLEETDEWLPQVNPKAKAGAPNVVWILIDDIGYGATTGFGGLIETPHIDSLANQGLRYTNFHTCAFSAPTRAALLTGRNQHSVHFGFFASTSYNTPGYDGYLPFEKATVAEILRENGYSTFALGKYHLTHPSDASGSGPFNRWPTGRGFDHYFGYKPSVASDDQFHPSLYRDTQIEPADPKGRPVNELLANEAIKFISDQKESDPEKPFFLYYASGAGHAPHQVSQEWRDKYKGKFDKGWDWYRKEVFERQKKLGVIPANTKFAPANTDLKQWDSLSDGEKKLFARYMENYAGFISETDHEIGRIVDYLKQIGQLDNTLIAVMVGDNGAEGAGGPNGRFNNRVDGETPEQTLQRDIANIDKLGTDQSKPLYPSGWAAATNTPFRYYKGNPCYEGGTHDPLILFYPNKITDKGGIRNQYSYINDILPTTIELVGAQVPNVINGYKQEPIEGVSLAYSIDKENKNAPEQHTIQYHEMTGSYAIYKDGWKLSFANGIAKRSEDINKKYLYNTKEDYNEVNDLSAKYPEKVKELTDLFDKEALKYNVYPLKNKWEVKNKGKIISRRQKTQTTNSK